MRGVGVQLDGHQILQGAELEVADGELAGLVGPNGSGKSTLLRCIYRALRPSSGAVLFDGHDVLALSPRDVAREAAVVVQEPPLQFDFLAREVVEIGRLPHKGLWQRTTVEDDRVVDRALEKVGMTGAADRSFTNLSGGEKQRVLIARAMAQESELLLLDEPTNHLDVRYQLEILDLVKELGVTALAALHDLNLAASYCDRVFVLSGGAVAAGGPPDEVLTTEIVERIFQVRTESWTHPLTGRRQLAFASLGTSVTEAPRSLHPTERSTA